MQLYWIYQSYQSKINASTKFGKSNFDKSKAKIVVQNIKHSVSGKCNYLIYTEICYKVCFNGYTWINGSHKTLYRH